MYHFIPGVVGIDEDLLDPLQGSKDLAAHFESCASSMTSSLMMMSSSDAMTVVACLPLSTSHW